jgi:peptidoglycan/xylan/chitin deacetylase (PgdA/CDA1 family)
MACKFIITIDTEVHVSNPAQDNPGSQIYGQTADGREVGISYMMDQLARRGFPATFFFTPYATHRWGEETLGAIARDITSRSFDLQLHTHVEETAWDGQIRPWMSDHPYEAQRGLIRMGIDRLTRWTGIAPTWHRAGQLGANRDTVRACAAEGLRGDSSFLYGWWQCDGIGLSRDERNLPREVEGIVELPITTFRTLPILRNYRPLDVNLCIIEELVGITRRAVARGTPYLVLLMHSFSFVRKVGASYHCQEAERAKFEALLDALGRIQGLEMTDLRRCGLDATALPRPSGFRSHDLRADVNWTYKRSWLHWDRGWKNRLLALFPLGVLLVVLILAGLVWSGAPFGR